MNISLRLSSPLCCHLADIYLQLHDSSALVWNLLSLNYFVLMIKWYFFCQHLFLYPISFYQSYVNSYLFTISVILKAKSSFLHKILSTSEVLELFFSLWTCIKMFFFLCWPDVFHIVVRKFLSLELSVQPFSWLQNHKPYHHTKARRSNMMETLSLSQKPCTPLLCV